MEQDQDNKKVGIELYARTGIKNFPSGEVQKKGYSRIPFRLRFCLIGVKTKEESRYRSLISSFVLFTEEGRLAD